MVAPSLPMLLLLEAARRTTLHPTAASLPMAGCWWARIRWSTLIRRTVCTLRCIVCWRCWTDRDRKENCC
uniref:Putative secreted peptide n=1 Tax=Anopheles braziliensis TaxID=58242 RepID=A0A2M3ZUD7_9DIPT